MKKIFSLCIFLFTFSLSLFSGTHLPGLDSKNGTRIIDKKDTVVFDLTGIIFSDQRFKIPVTILSDDIINALDFSFRYNQSKFKWDTIEAIASYKLQTTAFYNATDLKVRFTSNSFQNYQLPGPVVNIWFNVLSGEFTGNDIFDMLVYLNGEPCSYKFITKKPSSDCLDAPVNLKVSDTTQTSASLSWDANPAAKSYILRYRESGEQFWKEIIDIKTNLYLLEGLKAGTSYEWMVQNVCAAAGKWSVISQFKTREILQTCSTPDNQAEKDPTESSVSLSWSAVNGAKTYNLRYRKVGQLFWNQISEINTNAFFLDGLQAGTSYEWNVQSVCTTLSPWSANKIFNTRSEVGIHSIGEEYIPFCLFPNPCNGNQISIQSKVSADANIYDYQGRFVAGPFIISALENNHFSLPEIKSGIYLIQITSENKVYQLPFILGE